jgi:CBS domain-containing protein
VVVELLDRLDDPEGLVPVVADGRLVGVVGLRDLLRRAQLRDELRLRGKGNKR